MQNRNRQANSVNTNRLSENFRQARKRLGQQLEVARGRAAQNTSRFRAPNPNTPQAVKTHNTVKSQLLAPVRPVDFSVPKQAPAITDLQAFTDQKTQTSRLNPPDDLKMLGLSTPTDDAPTASFRTGQITQYLKTDEVKEAQNSYEDYNLLSLPDISNMSTSQNRQTFTGTATHSFVIPPAKPEQEYHTSFLDGFENIEWPLPVKTSKPVIAAPMPRKKASRKLRFIGRPQRTSQFLASLFGTVIVALSLFFILLYLRNYLDHAPDNEFSAAFGDLGEGAAMAHTTTAKTLSRQLSSNYQSFGNIPQADLRRQENIINNSEEANALLSKVNADVVVWGQYDITTKTFLLQLNLKPNGPIDEYLRHDLEEHLYELDSMPFVLAQPDDWNKPEQLTQFLEALYHYFKGDYQQAVILLGNLIKDPNINPANEVYLRFWRGNALYAVNNFPPALIDYNRAENLLKEGLNHPSLQQNPLGLDLVYNNRGVVEAATGDIAKAEVDYRQAIATNSVDALVYLNMARLQQEKLAKETKPDVKATIQKDLESNLNFAINQSKTKPLAPSYLYRSQFYYQQGKLIEARKDAQKAKQLDPTLTMADDQLGWIDLYSFLGNGDQNLLTRAYDEFQTGVNEATKLRDQYRNQWNEQLHTPGFEGEAAVADKRANDFQNQLNDLNFGLARTMLERGRIEGKDEGNPLDKLGRFLQGKKLWLEQARDKFLEIISSDANFADAHFYLGQTYYLLGTSNWEVECDKAKQLNPKKFEYYKTLADYYLAHNNPGAASKEYQQYINQDNNNYEAYLGLANINYRIGQYALAAGQADKAATLNPDDFESYLIAGKAHIQQKDYASAITDLQKAITIDSDSADAHYELGLALMNVGRPDNAIEEFKVASDYASKNMGSHKADPLLASNAHYYRGLLLQQKDRLDEAFNEFKAAVSEPNSENADAYLHLGDLYASRNQADAAELAYTSASKISNAPPLVAALVLLKLGTIEQSKAQYQQAEVNFDKAFKLQPGLFEAQLKKGEVEQLQGNFNDAITNLGAYLKANPKSAEALRFLGDAQRDKGDYKAAIDSYQKAVGLQVNLPEAYLGLGQCYLKLNNYAEALVQVDQALKYKPDYTDAQLTQGIILHQQGQDDQAFNSFQQTLKLDPNNAQAYSNIGEIQRIRNQPELAISSYSQAIKINPKDSGSHYQLGLIYGAKGDMEEAITQMQIALQLRPDWADAWYNLGKYYEQKANDKEAQAAFNNALANKANFSQLHYEADTHYELGNVLLTENKPNDALNEYNSAVKIAQSHKDDSLQAWFQEGSIYEARGDLTHAREAYIHVKDNSKDENLKRQADDSLRRISGQ